MKKYFVNLSSFEYFNFLDSHYFVQVLRAKEEIMDAIMKALAEKDK